MQLNQKTILWDTHYGLKIYAFILRGYNPGETVLSMTGNEAAPTKNPFNDNKQTLHVKIVDNRAQNMKMPSETCI